MINLLPEQEKKTITKEYQFRLVAVALVFCCVAVLIAILFLIPSYIMSVYRKKAVVEKQSSVGLATSQSHKDLIAALTTTQMTMKALDPGVPGVLPSKLFTIVLNDKTAHNSITNILYSHSDDGSFQLSLHGIAASRQSLLDFTTALRKEPLISKVDIPTSDFAKDSNIEFSFTISGAK